MTVHITDAFIQGALERLGQGKRVRRALPGWGRLHVDRPLPFLVVYRRPDGRPDPGTDRLVLSEASYLRAPGAAEHFEGVSALVQAVAAAMSERFGSYLVLELWAGDVVTPSDDREVATPPRFVILRSRSERIASTVRVLQRHLSTVQVRGQLADVALVSGKSVASPGMTPLMTAAQARKVRCNVLGLEVAPIYRSAEGDSYPLVRRALVRGLSAALKRTEYEFTRRETTERPPHYAALGRHSIVKAVREVDRQLAEVSNRFDLLLQVTPVNAEQAWQQFRRRRFQRDPEFVLRPLTLDPVRAKRDLFNIPIEHIEDPTLAQMFRDQQTELDRKLTMLGDRETPQFLFGSLQVFGGVDAPLLSTAYELLAAVPPRARDDASKSAVTARQFAARVEAELDYYRAQCPDMKSTVEIRDDIVGLMVSRGNVLVGETIAIPASRVDALLAHEVGTHVLTYVNGKSQPFRQLYVGLRGYEELQEGVAVLSEYLVGGLSRPRLRLLAARVVAVHRMIDGAGFVDVFRELDREHHFTQHSAFNVTMRVFRGGGLTKDVAYLRGLIDLLTHLREGGNFEHLLAGKFALEHVPIVEELQWRNVMGPSPLRPRHLDDPKAIERLDAVRNGLSVLDFVKRRSR